MSILAAVSGSLILAAALFAPQDPGAVYMRAEGFNTAKAALGQGASGQTRPTVTRQDLQAVERRLAGEPA